MGCGCPFRATEALHRSPAPVALGHARARGRVELDRRALKTLLSSRAEVIEALSEGAPKATGRPTANVSVLWRYYTSSVYRSGDLPAIATREALQNSVDAIRAAIRKRDVSQGDGRFDVAWDGATRTLTFTDNGVGMSTEDILERFLSLGTSGKSDASGSGDAAGGFGVAKAVILGTSETFRWTLRTRDNLARSLGEGQDVEIFALNPPIQGTILEIFDVPESFANPRWDRGAGERLPIEARIRTVLAACDLDGIDLRFNGEPLPRLFSRRRGSRLMEAADWGEGTTARVRGHRREAGDRKGGYWIRLNGLYQFHEASRRGDLPADIVIDLSTTVRPGAEGYPLNAARDALQGEAYHRWLDLSDEVERENESAGREEEDEIFEPEGRGEGDAFDAIAGVTAEAFDDPAFQAALGDAAGGLRDLRAAEAATPRKGAEATSQAPGSGQPWPVSVQEGEATPGTPEVIRRFLEGADRRMEGVNGAPLAHPVMGVGVKMALAEAEETGQASRGGALMIANAIRTAAQSAHGPGGGGLLQLMDLPRVEAALAAIRPGASAGAPPTVPAAPAKPKGPINPFGAMAGLRISRRHYDRARARRFMARWQASIPLLVVWDATLRMIASEGQIRRAFKPGFILNDEVVALAEAQRGKMPVLYLHPDRLKEAVKAHRARPMGVAGFLHGAACHELTHIDGRMGDGHDEAYIAARERLGDSTAHLLPAIAVLVSKLLKVASPSAEGDKAIATLEREVARLRARAEKTLKTREALAKAEVALERCRAEMAEAKALSRKTGEEMAQSPGCGCGGHGKAEESAAPQKHRASPAQVAAWVQMVREGAKAKDAMQVYEGLTKYLYYHPPQGFSQPEIERFLRGKGEQLLEIIEAALITRGMGVIGPDGLPRSLTTPDMRTLYRALGEDEALTLRVDHALRNWGLPGWRTNASRRAVLKRGLQDILKPDGGRVDRLLLLIQTNTSY